MYPLYGLSQKIEVHFKKVVLFRKCENIAETKSW